VNEGGLRERADVLNAHKLDVSSRVDVARVVESADWER
jgi:hypothetical protein